MSDVLTIIGGSVRAAAQSAVRAGLRVTAGDLYADVDLQHAAPGAVCAVSYPDDLATVVRSRGGPWMYTGALENHPRLVDSLAAERPLLGISGDALRRTRDPAIVSTSLRRAGFATPLISASARDLDPRHTWLRKPRRSAGGLRIARWSPGENTPPDDPEFYFQQMIAGQSCSAVYVGAGDGTIYLGATRQLIGAEWNAGEFCYAGSIGPFTLPEAIQNKLIALGRHLASVFTLVGLFGVDFILAGDEPWPVEINPRYTASVEVLERSLGAIAIAPHIAACRGETPRWTPETNPHVSGKAIVFARESTVVSSDLSRFVDEANANEANSCPIYADIPTLETRILAGHPVMTVFAAAADASSVERELRGRMARVENILQASSSTVAL